MSSRTLRAVSLFSNCGAGDVGYAKAGFQFEVMAEIDPRRLEVCLLNHPGAIGVVGDLRETWPQVVDEYRIREGENRPTLVAACPPCQGMSSARSSRGKENDADAGSRDKRNLLVTVIASVVKELQPDLVVLENVPAFLTRKIRHPRTRQPISAAQLLIEDLSGNYDVFPTLVDLCDYGVPQTRKRTFLTFVRRTVDALALLNEEQLTPYPIPSYAPDYNGEPITLRRALKRFRFPALDAKSPESATSEFGNGLHSVPVWQDRRYTMVAAIPPHGGGNAWDNKVCERCGEVVVGSDDAVCPICHGPLARPIVQTENGVYRLINGFRSSSYSRMKSDKPAATITTASGHIGSDHTIHPYENRVLSTLECARLQTLPSDFAWGKALEKWGHTNLREMIGEAVPPLFTKKHGKVLAALLGGWMKLPLLPVNDRRVLSANKKLELYGEKHAQKERRCVA
jgi:DNA (cytosine-5)-methyltransferase 1